jgi:hypothetical protein
MNDAILDDYQNVALKMADWSSVIMSPIRMRSSKGFCRST